MRKCILFTLTLVSAIVVIGLTDSTVSAASSETTTYYDTTAFGEITSETTSEITSETTTPLSEEQREPGDVNGDNKVTIADALEILKYLAGMSSIISPGESAYDAARVTGGEEPSIGDVLEILKYLAGMDSKIVYIIFGADGFRWPVDSHYARISQYFGCYDSDNADFRCETCIERNRFRCHNGIDIIGGVSEDCLHAIDRFCWGCVQIDKANIYAMNSGIVREVRTVNDRHGGFGNSLVIDHADGYSTLYAHLDEILVKEGQQVKRGEVIGIVGNTGQSTGPHLHLEMRYGNTNFFINGGNGIALDALSFFPDLM